VPVLKEPNRNRLRNVSTLHTLDNGIGAKRQISTLPTATANTSSALYTNTHRQHRPKPSIGQKHKFKELMMGLTARPVHPSTARSLPLGCNTRPAPKHQCTLPRQHVTNTPASKMVGVCWFKHVQRLARPNHNVLVHSGSTYSPRQPTLPATHGKQVAMESCVTLQSDLPQTFGAA
jgi:hypothetical protein